ncbi:MAG TPA: ABC transporter substrate-binding protein [Kofleriaceae bacterium]|jgi:ABC-type transport system substrate-binding protein|nr:ABC transporter substrate-binding protein [Kofleriaceae bacterium]
MMRVWMVVAVLAFACDPPDRGPRWRAAGNASPQPGGTLHLATKDTVKTLDPSIAYDEHSFLPVHAMFDTLVDYAPGSTELVPRLAERWEASSDGRTLRFWLRPGLVYADGTPIVAHDIITSLERALTTADSPFGPMLVELEGAQAVLDGKAAHLAGALAPSERELVLHLVRPNAAFLHVLAMPFTTPQRAEHVRAAGEDLRRRPLASGPYQLAAWDEGQALVLVRNPHHADPARGRIERIELREQLSRETQFLMFERGELDAVERPSHPDLLWVTSQPAWAPYVKTQPGLNVYGARMNVRVRPFDDRRVRQALNYGLDKDHTVKLLAGTAVPAHGMLPPGVAGRDDALAAYPYDPDKARALLAEAGYPRGLDLDFVTIADEEAEKLAAAMHGDFAAIGVRLHVSVVSFSTWVSVVGKPDGPPLSFASWIADAPDPASFYDLRFHSRAISGDSSTNDSFYANPALDGVLDAARGEPDPAARAALYRRAERILYDDAPWIWNYHQAMVDVIQPYVRDYAPHPVWGRDYTGAWLDLDAHGERVSW